MKKILASSIVIIGLTGLVLVSCTYKNNDNITPTYRNQSTGTGANPNINVVTVTGTQTVTNPATGNSSLLVGGTTTSGWIFQGCGSNTNSFIGINGSTTIQIKFNGPITAGTFALVAGTPIGSGQAQMIISGAPGQPGDVSWYSKSGTCIVTASSSGYSVTFSNIQCLQQNYLFPVVLVSGGMTC
jgi:hypothetical protein